MRSHIICLFVFIFYSATALYAQGVSFETIDWESALAKAKRENRYIFIDAYTDWCGWCKEMDKRTFLHPEVGALLNGSFVPLRLDMEEGLGKKLAMKYRLTSYPAYLVLNSQGKLVYRDGGFQDPKTFIATLHKALDASQQLNLKGVSSSLDLDFPEFYQARFAKGTVKKYPEREVIDRWLSEQYDLFNETAWSVISVFETNSSMKDWIVGNRHKLADLYGNYEVNQKILDAVITPKLLDAIETRSDIGLAAVMEMIREFCLEDQQKTIDFCKIHYYKETQDWIGFTRSVQQILDQNELENSSQINNWAWTLYEKCDDIECIRTAASWMRRVVEKDPEWAYLDTYAALLYKGADYEEAERIALQAIESGKDKNIDVTDTKQLLIKIRKAKESGG